ncbi:hypothetical protein PAXRUDRAFT_822997 [Paxillus rubicundulus Ve08.2h10]|uniref:Rgp1-domain-containing protein n=1 Tax=Paxillus rubicundulus Ve08.2h10 TaxID=930991 RepID=A0A0D0E990_9AGAM|nr:hypothetical protein PAXRUDRAFT_822997 [Paxillus rubicundulus Ve08.2h10]
MSANDLPTTDNDMDSAIRVHVTPSQASYFAGEQFSVTITFTNTRTSESPKARNTHKRGAHSISSAPLARPPTSPGIPRPAALPYIALPLSNGRDVPVRKRLIGQDYVGKSGKDMSSVLEQKRQSLLERSRSLSVDIPTSELPEKNGNISKESTSQYVSVYEFSEAGLPTTLSSPLSRTPDFELPPKHPHARKRSTLDGQIQLNEVQQSPPPSGLTSSSTSTFSLALDPIAEMPGTPYPGTPLPRSPSLTDSLNKHSLKPEPPHSYLPGPFQSRRPAQLGLGHGPPPVHPPSDVAASSRSAIFPNSNSELILYSYAQLLGTFSITPLPGVVMMPEHAQTLSALRLKLVKRPIVGGGCMDITSRQLIQERRRSHGRSASLTSGLFSLLSPSTHSAPSAPLPSSQPRASGRSRTPSVSSTSSATLVNTPTPTPTSTNGVGLGLINGGTEVDVDPETPLPTFEVQPAMLAVDLSLAPGESRTYTYTLLLPENLPPTFRGRSLKISYELVIGTCRASASAMRSSSSLGPTGANSTSRVMKVPIRVYNNVTIGKIQRPYDLLWPVAKRRVHYIEALPKVADGPSKGNGTTNVLLPCTC